MHKPLERDVLRACLDLLRLVGVMAWRNNTAAIPLTTPGGKRRFLRAGLVGSADILGVLRPTGRLLAVETKRPGGKPTPAQTAFLDAVAAAGGLALVVSDVRQLEEALRLEGILR